MLLERHFNPSRPINIHELNVEAPQKEPEVPFDLETDVIEEDWEEMENMVEIYRSRGDLKDAAGDLAEMIMLAPDRKKELDIDEAMFTFLTTKLGEFPNMDSREILYYSHLVKILFPERTATLQLDHPKWQDIKNFTKDFFVRDPRLFLTYGIGEMIKSIFPDYDLFGDAALEKRFSDYLGNSMEQCFQNRNWDAYGEAGRARKFFFPRIKASIPWRELKRHLAQKRPAPSFNPIFFFRFALSLKILAAKEIKITDTGVEIIMPEKQSSFEQATSPLPETRNF